MFALDYVVDGLSPGIFVQRKKKHESDMAAKIILVVCTFLDIDVDVVPRYNISIRMTKVVQ